MENNIEFVEGTDGFLYPQLEVGDMSDIIDTGERLNRGDFEEINKYGYERLEYLKEHDSDYYNLLEEKGILKEYLVTFSKEANEQIKSIMDTLLKGYENIPEQGTIEWVQFMNTLKSVAEDLFRADVNKI